MNKLCPYALLLLLCAPAAAGEAPDAIASEAEATLAEAERAHEELVDRDAIDRIRFLEQRLKEGSTYASVWSIGWTSIYGLGVLVQSGRAVITEKTSERADMVVSASKALIGATDRLVRPPHAMFGARELHGLAEDTPAQRAFKLARAEAMLRRNAHECDRRYHWASHLTNIGMNVVGGLIVWLGYDDWQTALQSAGIGIAVGELQIWTQPWRQKRDWKDYQRRFGPSGISALEARRTLMVVPTVGRDQGGAAMKLSF